MVVAVGSENPVKLASVREAFSLVWPEENWVIIGVAVSSGVSSQPMSDTESIRGATNRAKKALNVLKADFSVGLEGGLQKIGKRWFDTGWIVVIDKTGTIGISSSLRAHTPQKMIELIEKGHELGKVDDMLFHRTNSKQDIGHFGLMTNGKVTRKDGYRDAVIMALSVFLHTELFVKG